MTRSMNLGSTEKKKKINPLIRLLNLQLENQVINRNCKHKKSGNMYG